MSNANPKTDHLPKNQGFWKDAQGNKVDTTTVKVPRYLVERIKAIARQLHAEKIAAEKATDTKKSV
ncbi:MAG: hypothetical protein ACREPR_01535 [Brasilonema sp.]